MDMKNFVQLNEIAMRSETLGTDFEKVVLAELLKYTRGVTKIMLPGQKIPINALSNKSIVLLKPDMKKLENISRDGVYNVNLQTKLESTHPDFIAEILAGKNFFGFDNKYKLHIEAKSTTTGRFKFGQITAGERLFLDEDSDAYKYLMWFAFRDPEYQFQRETAISEFNSIKKEMLTMFKVLSGSDFRLVHAIPGNPVDWLIYDNTIDLLKGNFNISPRGVLRFVFEGADMFILEKVSSRTGEIRMYSKETTTKEKSEKLTPLKKKVEEATTPSELTMIFSTLKDIKAAVSGKADPTSPIIVKTGTKIRIIVSPKPSRAVERKHPRRNAELMAAGTQLDNMLDVLRDELNV